jgi:hypothetical protein
MRFVRLELVKLYYCCSLENVIVNSAKPTPWFEDFIYSPDSTDMYSDY